MSVQGLTFVSVVFEAEYLLLQLQARSMSRYLRPELVGGIFVIDNSARGMPEATRSRLLEDYGVLSESVQVLRPDEICEVPGTIGWRSQQILKLGVADLVKTERYVVLDAKNHLVRPLERSLFEAPDGRARVNAHSYENHPFRPALERTFGYFGADPGDYLGQFTATVTPFVLDRDVVGAMVRDIEATAGCPFGQEFVDRELTEFLLYSGWLVTRGGKRLTDHFELQQVPHPVVWPRAAHGAGVAAEIHQSHHGAGPFFSVHRRALARLDVDGRELLAEFWASADLFESAGEALRFMSEFDRAFKRAGLRKRVREAPHRVTAGVRRFWRPPRVRQRGSGHNVP
jgi:hypothetical protein